MQGTVFDIFDRHDFENKRRSESSYSYLNRSALPRSEVSRMLIEKWFVRIPSIEQTGIRSRFRSGKESDFTSALQELTLHELLWRQGCKVKIHPDVAGSNTHPDFGVSQPDGPDFVLEACTNLEIQGGTSYGPRALRIRDYVDQLDLGDYRINIVELKEGTQDLPQRAVRSYVKKVIQSMETGIAVERLATADGWRIEFTALASREVLHSASNVATESWCNTWSGPTAKLLDTLKAKGKHYGSGFVTPFVIALNSADALRAETCFDETLFGRWEDSGPFPHRASGGLWGDAESPKYTQISAVLFTQNLHPATLLRDMVDARLYLNPWASCPYTGVLDRLRTIRFENGSLREYPGTTLHKLLKLRLRRASLWE